MELSDILEKLRDQRLEKKALGALLIFPEKMKEVIMYPEEVFYLKTHRLVFRAMKELYQSEGFFDSELILNYLRQKGKDVDLIEVYSLTNFIDYGPLEVYMKSLLKLALKREICFSLLKNLELLPEMESLTPLFSSLYKIEEKYSKLLLGEENIFDRFLKDFKMRSFLASSFDGLNIFTQGFRKGDYFILGGRTGIGKTFFLLNIFLDLAKREIPVLYITCEIPVSDLITRLIGLELNRSFSDVLLNTPEEEVVEKAKELSHLPMLINEKIRSVIELKLYLTSLRKSSKFPRVVFIDYIQLLNYGLNSRLTTTEEITKISNTLKQIALDFGITIFAISQFSRKKGRETLSSLKGSSSLEQDSDFVSFLLVDDMEEYPRKMILEIKKNRRGPLGRVYFTFYNDSGKFEETGYE